MRTINLEDKINTELINMDNVRSFKGRDVVRIGDFNRDETTYILEVARIFGESMIEHQDDFSNFPYKDLLDGKKVTIGFKENSSRTRRSHAAAARALGAEIIIEEPNEDGTSATKGEALDHDIATCATYFSHLHVMRSKIEGAPEYLADYLSQIKEAHPNAVTNPVIFNGGDGAHEHPTQAFLDLLTLYHLFNVKMDGSPRSEHEVLERGSTLSGLTMLAVGDTLKGRTFKSLAKALGQFDDNEVVIGFAETMTGTVIVIDAEKL